MVYTLETEYGCFELEIEAAAWHYEDNSIGSYDFHGFVYFDDRKKDLIVDTFIVTNKADFSVDELTVIYDAIEDNNEDIRDALIEDLQNRLDDCCNEDND